MTDQELQQLAREYANKHLTSGCFNVNGEPRVDVRDLAYFYETLLSDIAKTHYIVSREKVTEEYDVAVLLQHSNLISDQDTGTVRQTLLEYIFGKSTFENLKHAEQ